MPSLTLHIGPHGALLDISIGISGPHEKALKRRNQPIPARVQVQGLIDTGASNTMIDPLIAQKLRLTPTGRSWIHTASSGGAPHSCDIYDVSLIIPHPAQSMILPAMQVSEIQLSGQGHPFLALIGRDILDNCAMFYLGQTKQVILQF